jgi:hypothetical protein
MRRLSGIVFLRSERFGNRNGGGCDLDWNDEGRTAFQTSGLLATTVVLDHEATLARWAGEADHGLTLRGSTILATQG